MSANAGFAMSAGELNAAMRYLRRSIAAGETRVSRRGGKSPPRKSWDYSMTPGAIRKRALRGVVI